MLTVQTEHAAEVKTLPNSWLRVEGLNKRYRTKDVVHNVSLEVHSAEIVGLLGPNGAGKTTSFYMIVGLVKPTGGSICLDGHEMRRWPIHRRASAGLGYLPQESSIFRGMTVAENILAVIELHEPDRYHRNEQLERLLQDLHISHLRRQPALSLSGGERRRVEIARALASRPKFILLDEPFAGVDPIAMLDIQHIILYLKSCGVGILITDHNVRETLTICDRVYIINEGRVLATGVPEQLVENEQVRQVYLGQHFRL